MITGCEKYPVITSLLSTCLLAVDCCLAEKQQSKAKPAAMQNGGVNDPSSSSPSPKVEPTWIHQIFQGTFTSETRCLNCETVIMNQVHFILCLLSVVFVYWSFNVLLADCCYVVWIDRVNEWHLWITHILHTTYTVKFETATHWAHICHLHNVHVAHVCFLYFEVPTCVTWVWI